MAASWWKLGLALGVGSAFCALVPSCADNNQSIFIRQMQALVAPQCTANADPTALVTSAGLLDLALTNTYIAFPLIGNQLNARGDTRLSRAEPNRVVLQGAEIRLLNPDGSERVPAFTVIATGTVDPTASSDPAYNVTRIEVIPPSVGLALRNQVLAAGIGTTSVNADIKVFGKTLGGRDVETGPFVMPIDLCYGCSVSFPASTVDSTLPQPNCAKTDTTGGTQQVTVCIPGQDAVTECSLCQGRIPSCTPCVDDTQCAGMASTRDSTQPSRCNTATRICE